MTSKTILIIGASRGIGAELVRQYLAAGDTVHATVRDVASPGEPAALNGNLTLHQLDVRDVSRTLEFAAAMGTAQLDVIIHSAGIYRGHTQEELIEVNAVAPIRTVEALLDAGALRPGGTVAIMTSQLGARRGSSKTKGGYSGSKMALNDEFRLRAAGWADHGATAIVIHPGWVRTDMGGDSAPLAVEDSVAGIRRLLANLSPDHHGRFWTWDGREHPW